MTPEEKERLTVYLGDLGYDNYQEAVKWCRENSLSLLETEDTDVSDVSYNWDTVTAFRFASEQDALMFSLKFK